MDLDIIHITKCNNAGVSCKRLFVQFDKKEYNSLTATIITTLLFTLLHGGAFNAGIIAVINVITMSVFMSLLLVYTNTLIAPIMVHGIWNIIGSLMGYVSLAEDYPVLINSIIIGNKTITGGEYKLEGSVIVLILNITAVRFNHKTPPRAVDAR
jgi:hypothetical protein